MDPDTTGYLDAFGRVCTCDATAGGTAPPSCPSHPHLVVVDDGPHPLTGAQWERLVARVHREPLPTLPPCDAFRAPGDNPGARVIASSR